MSRPQPPALSPDSTKSRERIYLIFICVLIVCVGVLGYRDWRNNRQAAYAPDLASESHINPNAPFSEDVRGIISSLRYTYLSTLMKNDVSLQVDFSNGTWKLNNVHTFDKDGRVILVDGYSGLCGDLAAYTYQNIEKIFPPRYNIRFVRAAESNYFPAPLNVHYVLSITDSEGQPPSNTYILDPSFHRYGPLDEFEGYLFFEYLAGLQSVQRRSRDNIEIINRAVPVHITHNIKMSLIVTPENAKFSPDHFTVAILATRRHQYMPRTIFKVSKVNGKKVVWEREDLDESIKGLPEYRMLRQRVEDLFDRMPAR